jgi:flavin-dependent dehydrogenase
MKIDYVHVNPGGDYYSSMYIDGQLKYSGDEYHDKITVFFDGYESALRDYLQIKSITVHNAEHEEWEDKEYRPSADLHEYLGRLAEDDFQIQRE